MICPRCHGIGLSFDVPTKYDPVPCDYPGCHNGTIADDEMLNDEWEEIKETTLARLLI